MPSENHRINLTVSDEVYKAILECQENNGWPSIAGMTLSLVVVKLRELRYLPQPYCENDDE